MSCEHLVCAHCAGPVVEGRCSVCRAAKAHVHAQPFVVPPQMLALAVAVLLVLAALAYHLR